ncbi:Serine--tRNA ligase [Seminavis robusta]|uniref:Serine--tRNA ligase n=1 Tax=Seminavis robusta TaxID=568900 RepID=A0A9N8E0N3_9STRA|nr:Serine--tRNA ligase [Seminavis robusta]|eukprot:Sro530_g161270.1 Serine--tRNA ligase (522) ;mRNA; f:43719-45284
MVLAAGRHSCHALVSRQFLPRLLARGVSSTTRLLGASTAPAETTSRISRQDFSLEVRTIATEPDMVISHLKSRRASSETIEAVQTIASLQEKRVALIQERDSFLNQRKEASAVVGKLMREQSDDTDAVEAAKEKSNQAAEGAAKAELELDDIQTQVDNLFAGIPNLLDDIVPDGDDDTQNEQVSTWGDIEALPKELGWTDDFTPAWHDDVAAKLGGYKSEEAVKMSGARFVGLSGKIAQLERAIAMYFLDLHTSEEHGYTEVSVPLVVGRSALEGTSQLPKFQEDLFAITPESHTCNGEDAFLIPTAEVPVTNLHRDSVLEESDLPISYVAWTPCFRAEAGSYGRDTKGLIRTHQFQKVEMVKITSAETSDEQHELLTQHAEACLKNLELPYRKVRLCSGDIGFSARHCYDLEVWLPGAQEYREISSCSNTGDFQARRMALRYRPKAPQEPESSNEGGNKKKKKKAKKPKPQLCHTINGSGLAVGRTLVAVLENYQRPDGSVLVPKVLRPYMGGQEILEVP